MAVAVFVGGAFLGAAFGEVFAVLHDTVKTVGRKVLEFKSVLKSLESNLDLLAPVVEEISRLNRELVRPEEETKSLIEDMKKAVELIRTCSAIPGWNDKFQAHHSKQLTELDKAIVKFCQVHMPAQIKRDTLQILKETSHICEELKALREENKLKKEKAQILITPSGQCQCGKTTTLEIHGHDVLIKGFASISLMTSLSTQKIQSSSLFSYSTPRRRYDIYVSGMNFADLEVVLERNGVVTSRSSVIITFREDIELERVSPIDSMSIKAIEESMFAILILSKNYASSSWRLRELQKIVSCKRETGMRILPIFYGVNPSDVRKQEGPFAEAFRRHEEHFRENKEWVETWRAALRDVTNLRAWNSTYQSESNIIQSVVEEILHTKSYTF